MDTDEEEEELAGDLDQTTAHSRAQSTLKKHMRMYLPDVLNLLDDLIPPC